MPVIEDSKGTKWHLAITGATLRGIQSVAPKKNPIEIATEAWIQPALGMAVLYQICRPQAEAKKIDEETFAERFDSYGNVPEAIAEALENFFPQYAEIFKIIPTQVGQMLREAVSDLQTGKQAVERIPPHAKPREVSAHGNTSGT
jgi:hypothetical protein